MKNDFPILDGITYLDSAATTQKPQAVIDAVSGFYERRNSNISRGLYDLAEQATHDYEETRKKTAAFINSSPDEVIFTKNTTEGINLVMRGYGEKFIKHGKITTSIMEHHSNYVPWIYLSRKTNSALSIIDIDENGELSDVEKKIRGANIVAVSAASNVLGTINDIQAICSIAREEGAISVVDGAQFVPSNRTDVKKIGCDFLSFSGHKMLAPFGVGVLFGRSELLEEMDPMLFGSEMIRSVTRKDYELERAPAKFETGTPDPAAVAGFSAALDYLKSIGMEKIEADERRISSYLVERLSEVDGITIAGNAKRRAAICSFDLKGVHPHDVSAILNEDKICVRSGHHCAMPLHERLGLAATTRASCYIYNDRSDIDRLAESLEKARKIFS